MKFEQSLLLLHILGFFIINTCFIRTTVLCDDDTDNSDSKEPEVEKLIDNCGNWDERSAAPWRVTIFYRHSFVHYYYLHLCDGSLITPNLIITAAQCYTNTVGDNVYYEPYTGQLHVVAGKHNINASMEEDAFNATIHAQAKELLIYPGYKETLTDYSGNLAVLVLQEPFQITDLVQPVCFDRNNKIDSQHFLPNNHENGGWNVDQYRYIEVNATDKLDLNKCFNKIPSNHRDAVVAINNTCRVVTGGAAFCRNLGGGIVLNDEQEFFIRGVVGFTPTIRRDGCDPNLHYGIFTNISNYYEFILTIIDDYEIKIGDCPGLTTIPNGKFEILGQRQGYTPGAPIRNYELIKFTCDISYVLEPKNPVVTCLDGNFTTPIPKCKRVLKGAEDEVINVVDECGYWDENPPAPWNVAVYSYSGNNAYYFRCGGSMITANIILTAAQCMTEKNNKETNTPAEQFYIVAGKYYKEYHNAEDKDFAQRSQVKEYYIPPEFEGGWLVDTKAKGNFIGNLAVLVLKNPFHITNVVQPICLDRNNKIESRQVTAKNRGIVTAWQVIYRNGLSELRQANSTYINKEQCLEAINSSWIIQQFTPDTFCADYIGCGSSGGGIAYKWYNNNKQQFYIRGLKTALKASENFCIDPISLGIFTNITYHKDYILNIVDQQLRTDSCPSITLENGQFSVLGREYKPKDSIPNYNLVKLTCNVNYTLHPANPLIACNDGAWNVPIPKCKLTCPPTISRSADVTCTVDGNPVDCRQPLVDGAVARSRCKAFYIKAGYDIPVSKCIKGSWSDPIVRCAPECGEVVSKGITYIVNGTSAKKGDFPWHIALYRLEGNNHEYKCGGSIINPLIILTAAHCVTDEKASKFPAEEFFVGAGKYYSDYYSTDDIFAQKRQVKEYHIPTEYKGYQSSFAGDLAVIVVKRPFRMTNVVQPVCVDWDGSSESEQLKQNNIGSIVGWGYVDPNIPEANAELKLLYPPFIDWEQCYNEVPNHFRRWLTLDKFCAGFRNGSSICKGDSGGGLVFKGKDSKEKYFLRGLVSVGPVRKGVCDDFQYGVYTKISYYSAFILNITAVNRVKD